MVLYEIHRNYFATFLLRITSTIWPITSISWLKCCSLMVMPCSKMIKRLFIQLASSKIVFLDMRINYPIYNDQHNYHTWILSNLCSLYWSEIFDSTFPPTIIIQTFQHSDRIIVQNSFADHTKPLLIHSKKVSSCFECQRITNTALIKLFFVFISIFVLPRY